MADEKVYVDEADGVKRVMNNLKLYVKLLAKFRNENNLDDLNTHLKAGDLEKAQGAAHTIKGLAGNLSLLELQKQALEIETQIKAKSVDPATVESLNVCFAETLAAVDQVLAKNA
ncbi:MAG: Hpt domain-containing protein [Spirochaetaceae bacterium]|jgi:HPt (histidine-containing phosphotransfer) domain-containing protein|nr:Hpt domain-containing protein [Spirochaetaceae bacterium]